MGFIQRKAICAASLELTIKLHEGADGATHLDTTIKPSLGPAQNEERVLRWEDEVEVKHPLFGNGKARSRWARLDDPEVAAADEFLAQGWEEGTEELILMENTLDSGVVTRLAHGFEVVKGERHYVRHVVSKNKKGETAKVRVVYNYEGSS